MNTKNTEPSAPSTSISNAEPDVRRSPGPRSQPIDLHSSRPRALLMQQPITATPVPRIHVGPCRPDGSITVCDRATGRTFLVYTPRRNSEFHAGHLAGLWYVRTSEDDGASPVSPGFPTTVAAIETIRSPHVSARGTRDHRQQVRVIC